MISRPIVIAPVIGIVLGNPYAGLIIGAMLELFWMDRSPIGIYIPPNDSIAAALAASLAILAGQSLGVVTKELTALSILLAIPFGILAKKIDVKITESNNRLSDQALEAAKALDLRAIERKTYLGLARVFIFYVRPAFHFTTHFRSRADLDISPNTGRDPGYAVDDVLFSAASGHCRRTPYHQAARRDPRFLCDIFSRCRGHGIFSCLLKMKI